MSEPDEYRANAQECDRMASISPDPDEKAAWLKMAQQWRSMIPGGGGKTLGKQT